jgi:hypothetical protein
MYVDLPQGWIVTKWAEICLRQLLVLSDVVVLHKWYSKLNYRHRSLSITTIHYKKLQFCLHPKISAGQKVINVQPDCICRDNIFYILTATNSHSMLMTQVPILMTSNSAITTVSRRTINIPYPLDPSQLCGKR